ncbi:SigE family RNA polymerase sigma factor [Promicromonospora panici]|uniref:SigE family RNA polymerase sigma factor n=1 Tax=Promicromonospora panici TaxID=2219658 RepID=UPI00101D7962|nr:SigE family RNA polymerase sigma factor [Promicromonospora panici]
MSWSDDLERLATERGTALVGYAYVLCGDVRQAEDLVQDALVKVYSRLRPPGKPVEGARPASGMRTILLDGRGATHTEAYVRRTVLNLYLDGWRRQRKWAQIEPVVATSDWVRSPESGITARADVVHALTRLTPRQRSCVVLRYFEDMTIPQVAETIGVAPGTVKRYLSDALHAMRDVLQPDGAPGTAIDSGRGTR